MNLAWLRDREYHNFFEFFWEKGNSEDTLNEADCYTKHHPTIYHRHIRGRYVNDEMSTFTENFNTICNVYCKD